MSNQAQEALKDLVTDQVDCPSFLFWQKDEAKICWTAFPDLDLAEKNFHCEMLQDRKDILKAQLAAFGAFLIWPEELREQEKQLFYLLDTTISLRDKRLLPLCIGRSMSSGQFSLSLPTPSPSLAEGLWDSCSRNTMFWPSIISLTISFMIVITEVWDLIFFSVTQRITAYHYLCSKISPLWD